MLDVGRYSAVETLCNGQRVLIRALKPEDRDSFIAAIGRTTAQTLYRRLFAVKRGFTDEEEAFFLNVDFVSHVALISLVEESGQLVIAGGARYFVTKPGQGEVAFTVVDKYQRQGIGTALMHHLTLIARESGLQELIAQVLPENLAMLKTFERSGLPLSKKHEAGIVHIALRLS